MIQNLHKHLPIYRFQISGDSMMPTLRSGDNVLVNRLYYLLAKPKIGDIVALKDPRDKKILIKRISEIKNGQYFVLGDNKTASVDSRTFGWIKKKDIIGKLVYPHDKFSI